MVWHGDAELPQSDLIVLPGGFSYGDFVFRSGAMAARSPVMREVIKRAKAGTPVLGICNGFQVLTEARLLPGVLMRNSTLQIHLQGHHLRVERTNTRFTGHYEKGEVVRFPIAHKDGSYFADDETLKRLEGRAGRVAFRYCDTQGQVTADANPNGSRRSIAKACLPTRLEPSSASCPIRSASPTLPSRHRRREDVRRSGGKPRLNLDRDSCLLLSPPPLRGRVREGGPEKTVTYYPPSVRAWARTCSSRGERKQGLGFPRTARYKLDFGPAAARPELAPPA